MPMLLRSLGSINGRSARRIYDRAFRHHALRREPPQGDQEPTRHRHHHYFTHAASRAANALAKPADLSRAGLIALPEPSQLDHHGSQASITSFANPLLTLRGPATERCRSEPGIGAECLAIGEFAHEAFSYKHGGALHTNPP